LLSATTASDNVAVGKDSLRATQQVSGTLGLVEKLYMHKQLVITILL